MILIVFRFRFKPESVFIENFAVNSLQFFDQLEGENFSLATIPNESHKAVDVIVEKCEVSDKYFIIK